MTSHKDFTSSAQYSTLLILRRQPTLPDFEFDLAANHLDLDSKATDSSFWASSYTGKKLGKLAMVQYAPRMDELDELADPCCKPSS
ncbi:unnamed protein product [Fusarium equiseti]|uniref:Uncharacterized protein n=1 Tax=Fusarium equiseti TaxID=61235 RepID=A0A8J2IRB3_FUSEQ|nr:unnamed protein product [Fusarium equiseti]